MDVAWPQSEQQILREILDEFRAEGAAQRDGIEFHAVRTRRSAARRFVDFHVLVPGEWSVKRGHDLVERIETRLARALPNLTVLSHLEPADDPSSYDDEHIDRLN
jgi:divalent metal cation (Fe/Co/Zn/Cd) transporter